MLGRQCIEHGSGLLRMMRRSCGSMVVVACLAVTLTRIDAAPPSITLLTAREVRTVTTAELGLSTPEGIAFMPDDGSLLVLGAGTRGTTALRMTTGGDRISLADQPSISAPATVAFEPSSGQASAVSGDALVRLPGSSALDLTALGLRDPQGSVFDGEDGVWTVLDAATQTLVRVAVDGASVTAVGRTSLRGFGARHLQGLALNPASGLLYVASSDQQRLLALDGAGELHATYRLSDLGLVDLRAMTFAPTTDTTDDAALQHLFIADAGDRATGGHITEVSLESGVTLAAGTPVVTAQLVQTINTANFSPASPDPSGIVYLPGSDRMQIIDSEVDETTGAGYHGVNMWQITRTGTVTATGTTWTPGPGFSREPTGLGFDPATNTLFISDDSANRVWLDRPGPDARHGTADDVVSSIDAAAYGSGDPEDPEFDPTNGHLFFIDGTNLEVYEVDPVNGVFGDGDDLMTHFDVAQFGMLDIEGLSSDAGRGTLLVGDRNLRKIFEYTKAGALVRIIDASGIPGMKFLSGLGRGPASDGSGRLNYWTVDRAVDNGPNPSENDGKIFELRVDADTAGAPPVPLADSATTGEDAAVAVNVAANDSDPDGNLAPSSVTVTVPPANGTATPNGNGTVTYTPAANFNGSNAFTYQICDTTSLCATALVTITVRSVVNSYFVSLDGDATVPGIVGTVKDEDLIVYNRTSNAWAMHFDASDVGITTSDLEDFFIRADGRILMSFSSSSVNVPGLTGGPNGTLIGYSDVILFTPITTGDITSGSFSFYFDGSDVGLDTSSERLDGLHELPDGSLLVSTTGSASVPGLTGADEDILRFSPITTGAATTGTWTNLQFDGSDVLLTSGNDDLDAIAFDVNGDLLYSTLGDNTVPGTRDEDVNRFTGVYGPTTSGSAVLELALGLLGILSTNDLDGLHTAG